ncbi:MAG: glycosyltransferase family 39 protein [Caldilineaceae bacterium]
MPEQTREPATRPATIPYRLLSVSHRSEPSSVTSQVFDKNLLSGYALLMSLLIAFGLRAYHLDYQSFWSDEGISLQRSAQTLPTLLATMPVEHLPGYFLLLHYWLPWTGEQDFAIRFLSLWPSVLSVALLYRLGADWGNRRVGLLAALLLATNPFQIWYAQEARTYSWLLAASLLATWCFWRLLTRHRAQGLLYLVGYILATTLTVYLHYYGFLTPFAHTLFAVGWTLWRRDWRFFGLWTVGGLVTVLLFAPWIGHTLQIFNFTGWRDPMDPAQIPWLILSAYTVGSTLSNGWQEWLPWLYLGLMVMGAGLWLHWRTMAGLFLLTCILAPLAVVLGLTLRNPDFHERYTMTVSGPLLLLVAAPLAGLRKPLLDWLTLRRGLRALVTLPAAALLLVLLAGNAQALRTFYTDATFHKPDFRATVQMIARFGRPGDVVVVDGPDPSLVFLHYYDRDYPVHDLRFLLQADEAAVDQALTAITANATRVWEVLYFHEPWRVQAWLARHAWTSPPSDHNGIRLTLYGLPDQSLAEQQLDLPVGPALLLTKAMLPATPVQPGDLVRVSTHWQVTASPPDYKFSLRLQTPDGQIVTAQDYAPHNWFTPTTTWPVGAEMVERRAFHLLLDFAPGHYEVTLRLYDPVTGTVAETPLGQDIVLGVVAVEE